jgi:hypothetical protein
MAELIAKKSDRPKYQVTEKCYLNEKFYDPETQPFEDYNPGEDDDNAGPQRKPIVIFFEGVPNYTMIPLNEAAKAMVEKHKAKPGVNSEQNPINALSLVG